MFKRDVRMWIPGVVKWDNPMEVLYWWPYEENTWSSCENRKEKKLINNNYNNYYGRCGIGKSLFVVYLQNASCSEMVLAIILHVFENILVKFSRPKIPDWWIF